MPLCIPYLCRDKCIIQMICIVQVILEHLPFVSEPILVCAFETERVLVDGSVVGPSHSLWEMVFHRHETEVRGHSSPNSHCVCVFLYFDISNCNCDVIGERERANLVVQLAPFFCIYIYLSDPRPHTVMFYVVLNMCHMRKIFCITHCTLDLAIAAEP